MRSPTERAFWAALAVTLVVGAGAAWYTAEQWLPQAQPWVRQTLRQITRPGPETLPQRDPHRTRQANAASAPAPQPRKCMQGDRIIYTDQACPAGSTELAVQGGAVTVMPQP